MLATTVRRLRMAPQGASDGHTRCACSASIRPPVVSFHYGLPPKQTIAQLEAAGIVLFCTAISLAEAEQAAGAGVDAIVAQGYEAGGHRGIFDPSAKDLRMDVLPLARLLTQKGKLPMIATRGTRDGAGIASVLALGATVVQFGMAFVACMTRRCLH